jgi:hypothetical protein
MLRLLTSPLTHAEAKTDVFDYIERFYSQYAGASTIGYLRPMEFEWIRAGASVVYRLWSLAGTSLNRRELIMYETSICYRSLSE